MTFLAEVRISGEDAVIGGVRPFRVQPADPTGEHPGAVMIDKTGVNCVRYVDGKCPVIFTDAHIADWMARDLNRR